jgi:two-component system sensor histidine kinase FlrB
MRQQDDLNSRNELQRAFERFERYSGRLESAFQQLCSIADHIDGTPQGALTTSRPEDDERLQRLSAVVDALPAAVLVLDGDGTIVEFNPAAAQLLETELGGRPWRDVAAAIFAPRWDDGHDVSLRSGRRVNVSTQALGQEPGQIVLITDVTDTRRLQQQLAEQGRFSAKGEMAAALAHQMRTPLAAALLYASNLTGDGLSSDKRAEFLSRLLDRLRSMEQLIEDMLSLARTCRLAAEPIEVARLWAEFQAEIDHDSKSTEFCIEWRGNAVQRSLLGNRAALFSVMGNLVMNSRQMCGGRGRLQITIDVIEPGILTICFDDDGPGIEATECERIFEPFYSTRDGGTGLGLAVARAVAVAHGGGLRAEAADAGARFILSLPLQSETVQPAAAEVACG